MCLKNKQFSHTSMYGREELLIKFCWVEIQKLRNITTFFHEEKYSPRILILNCQLFSVDYSIIIVPVDELVLQPFAENEPFSLSVKNMSIDIV